MRWGQAAVAAALSGDERQQPSALPAHLEPALCGQHLALGGHGGQPEGLWQGEGVG